MKTLGEKVKGRDCGSCSACCTLLSVDFPGATKPAGQTCKHVQNDGGCGIYKKRPNDCQYFHCVWLTLEVMPEFTKPDVMGVMFRYDFDHENWNPFAKACVIATATGPERALYSKTARACYDMFWRAGKPVWIEVANQARTLVDEYGREIGAERLHAYEDRIRIG